MGEARRGRGGGSRRGEGGDRKDFLAGGPKITDLDDLHNFLQQKN